MSFEIFTGQKPVDELKEMFVALSKGGWAESSLPYEILDIYIMSHNLQYKLRRLSSGHIKITRKK